MPRWTLVCGASAGLSQGAGQLRYVTPAGLLNNASVEAYRRFLARDTYTLRSMYVRVISNTMNGNTIVTSRIGGGPGAQSVTIGAGATGIFQDLLNSDNLVSGNLFNSQIDSTAAGVGNIFIGIISYILQTAANTTPMLGGVGFSAIAQGSTVYLWIGGRVSYLTVEAATQYTLRTATTLSNMRVYVSANGLLAQSTLTIRRDGVNGNQVINIGAGATGEFEDAVNTDAYVAGNIMNYMLVCGAGGTTITVDVINTKSTSTVRQMVSAGRGGWTVAGTYFLALEGANESQTANEADVQAALRIRSVMRNFFVGVSDNTLNDVSTFRTRRNGGNGNMSVSVGAAATGVFEDLANTDLVLADDLYNYQAVLVGAGQMRWSYVGVEQLESAVAPTGNIASKLVAAGVL